MLVAQEDNMKEELKATERKAEAKADKKWNAWAEKPALVNAGKAVSAERKK